MSWCVCVSVCVCLCVCVRGTGKRLGFVLTCWGPVGSAEPSGAPGDGKDVEHSGSQFSLSSPYRAMVGPPSPESLHDLWLQPTALFD